MGPKHRRLVQVDDLFFRGVIAKLAVRSLRLGAQLFFLRSLLQGLGPVSDPREAPIETSLGGLVAQTLMNPTQQEQTSKLESFFKQRMPHCAAINERSVPRTCDHMATVMEW